MIPKLIHLLWINRNSKPIPAWCAPYITKWRALHPGYIVSVWGLDEVRSLQDDMFEKLWADIETDEAAICNLIRMVIIHKFGGIYADIDTEPIKSFEPLLSCPNLGVGRFGPADKFEINLFFAEPNNPVLEFGIDFYKKSNPDLYRFGGRTPLIMDAMDKSYPASITKYPQSYFQGHVATPETYSLHWPHALRSWHEAAARQYAKLRNIPTVKPAPKASPLGIDPQI